MAEARKAAAKPAVEQREAPSLVDASSATDPVVHQLLAQRVLLEQEDQRAKAAIEAAWAEIDGRKAQHEAVNARLAELGYR